MNSRRRIGPARGRTRGGWTIVECVVVVFVIGDLLLLLMPWLESLKEPASANDCAYHLQLLGRGAMDHASRHGPYPSGGWGFGWLGDPDRGFGAKQPGGWMYSVLPFIDQKDLWGLGAGVNPLSSVKKKDALLHQATTVVEIFYCPTRRPAKLYPYKGRRAPADLPVEALKSGVCKSDYAINVGDGDHNEFDRGPASYGEGDAPGYNWHDTSEFSGVSYLRSEIKPSDVTDGLAQTYLIGEKYLPPKKYTTGHDKGDNDAATCGFGNDTSRVAGGSEPAPRYDTDDHTSYLIWGSAHPEGTHFVFCDGSVRIISYQIDADIHRRLANRHDGQKIEPTEWSKWVSGD